VYKHQHSVDIAAGPLQYCLMYTSCTFGNAVCKPAPLSADRFHVDCETTLRGTKDGQKRLQNAPLSTQPGKEGRGVLGGTCAQPGPILPQDSCSLNECAPTKSCIQSTQFASSTRLLAQDHQGVIQNC